MKKAALFAMILLSVLKPQSGFKEIDNLFEQGEYSKATKEIGALIASGKVNPEQEYNLRFTLDLMERIKMDFTKNRDEVKEYIAKFFPGVTDEQLDKWENEKALECKMIDGEKKYFRNAARNLFRIDKEALNKWNEVNGVALGELDKYLLQYLPELISESKKNGEKLVNPVTITVKYTLVVDPNAVPPGEVVRCWLPFPAENRDRQTEVEFLSANCENFVIAPFNATHRTIYMEAVSEQDSEVVFEASYKFKTYGEYNGVDFNKHYTIDTSTDLFEEYTAERPPHIAFTDDLKNLSAQIIGNETEPVKKFKLIYEWINDNIPWASAIEYSTIPAIASYCKTNMHGDCGIQSLLFITLCRMNGIPAKWQSGWMLHPPEVNLHDWAEIYFDETGWIPVDQSFKLKPSDDPLVRYYYLGNTDNYHFIVNDDYSGNLFPAKIYPRSETVDFQRGEVEWRGGNLYFDKWSYYIDLNYSPEN
ncbi:MAG: transglutaminase domain-containing protein [Ignavibacteriales bacterium]|nr:hypothetical protein [Ignavibacteriaceae bacterium]MBW7874188.1 transglutaminase domain-containing protein [Ignavibacteria bacterium]MBZ0197872.1 transglutaminase domain-containing protein [Ignavibacteriaceae bacterium]MCZ2142963.1 transglutaminase domain-containing protein [Ignavibacteriales bacterium]WKZ72068.1 MAG: transglutaminase domain-containing protein [Ignavibacteriaceae bacterium]